MECLIIILVVSMIYFILPSNRKKEQWDGSDVDGGTYGVADFNYNTPTFPYDEVVKKKSIKKKTDKAKPLPKKVKKKTKRKTKKKWWI